LDITIYRSKMNFMSILDPREGVRKIVQKRTHKEVPPPLNGRKRVPRSALMAFGSLLLIGLGAVGVYWGVKEKPEWFGLQNNSQAQVEVDSLVKEVGKVIALPEGEVPTVATVTDEDKVKDQPFFANAKVGDKVLVYTGAKKAYLYRPSEKRVIDVGVVNVQNDEQPEVAGESTKAPEEGSDTETPTQTTTPVPTRRQVTNTPTPSFTPTP
jgi:hypothetical protein